MTVVAKYQTPAPKIDSAALFKKLGLAIADERPMMAAWREANALWRQERAARVAAQERRVVDHLRRYQRRDKPSRARMGRPRAVWCVELRLRFVSMTHAANFVGRKPSHISQSLKRGVRCGTYHWEEFDPSLHQA